MQIKMVIGIEYLVPEEVSVVFGGDKLCVDIGTVSFASFKGVDGPIESDDMFRDCAIGDLSRSIPFAMEGSGGNGEVAIFRDPGAVFDEQVEA